ncbi:MAG: VWA domain-containing protein [Desulfococcaceae bacterium]|jgi:Ca-activated chloride channel family protein|nr:VWA domain-containing protein [Desulfococcaceae bacterium]
MKFARTEMLFLIWAVPVCLLIFIYGTKKRRRILADFSSRRGLKSIIPFRGDRRRKIRAGLLLVCLGLLALALSGPQYGYRWQETEQRGVDLMIALDCSRSMLAADIKPTRLDRAKHKIYDLLTIMEGDRVALLAFAGTAFLQCPLTLDYDAFHIFLQTLTPDYLPVGGTDISNAVYTAMKAFDEKVDSEKAIILITDGENTGPEDPVKAAEELRKAGIKLFCIGVGSEGGVPVPDKEGGLKKDSRGQIVVTRLDEETLKKMALLTGGAYVRSVAGDMDLEMIYQQEIREKMEQSALAAGKRQVWEDRYQWVLLFAFLALAAEIFLPSVKKAAALILLLAFISMPRPALADAFRDGLTAYEKGEYEKALKLFIDAQLDDPENSKIKYNIANTYYKLEDYESAAQNYTEALKDENSGLKEKILYNLGNAQFRRQKYDEAIENYAAALKIAPDDAHTQQNMEFVKQIKEQMEKQEEQQKQECDKEEGEDRGDKENPDQENNKDDSEKKDGNQEDNSEKQDGRKQESGEDSQKEGEDQKSGEQEQSSPRDGKEDEKEAASPAPGEKNGKQEDEKAEEQQTAKAGGNGENAEEQKQAERMLNRLKDEPGRAMIPAYRKQEIEKDW